MHLLYFQVPLTTELKFAKCLDIFVQMCITKLKNDNEKINACTECANINFFFFLRVILAVCISNCYFIGQVPSCYCMLSGILVMTS